MIKFGKGFQNLYQYDFMSESLQIHGILTYNI